ncbi:hypothetical protein [Longimicrobium sp.]|uniref:hypothetical protein n=1 Tax=Longimicrobium sp. TaxID=2029185 RepID=UPI002B7C5F4C|nr:hypothetical protein [Longimicrobium sp.]HSU16925.1 hypothetical protein [Longimicrobium sp.]
MLLSLCPPGAEIATLAYGSTRTTDARHGAEAVLVEPGGTSYRGTGLVYPTYLYPSRLVTFPADALGAPAGVIIDEMPLVRESLRRALGLGTGVTGERNVPGANRRGRLVELVPVVVEEWEVRYALVVTAPRYSRTGFQQTVVPLLPDECEPRPLDVIISPSSALAHVHPPLLHTLLAATMVATVHQPSSVLRYLDIIVEPELMGQVESALILHFGL